MNSWLVALITGKLATSEKDTTSHKDAEQQKQKDVDLRNISNKVDINSLLVLTYHNCYEAVIGSTYVIITQERIGGF